MRFTKMLGLAAIAALATMALIGAGTASATTLCKTSEDPCGAANRYPSGTVVTMQSTNLSVKASFIEQKCDSTLNAKTTGESSESLPVQILSLSFGPCTGSCLHIGANTPWNASIAGTGSGAANLTVQKMGITLTECAGIGIKCTFSGENAGAAMSGNPLKAVFKNASLLRTEGFPMLCGEEATFNATFTVTSPTSLFIAKEP